MDGWMGGWVDGCGCGCGCVQADQPASNVHNTISNYMAHLGMDEEALANHLIPPPFTPAAAPASRTASALVTFKAQEMPVALELAVAFQVAAMEQYARAQVASQAGQEGAAPKLKVALTVPTHFNARQTASLQDACAIAGFEQPLLVAAADALAHEYKARHRTDLERAINASASGSRHVAFVDIGHSSAAAVVVKYALHDGAVQAKVVSAAAEVGAGGGAVDALLLEHFEAKIDASFGAGTCSGPKSQWRLLKACERVKKMLSTIDSTKVSVDGLIPDQDVSIEFARGQLELLTVPVCRRISELVTRVLGSADCGGADGGIDAVEVVGGGTRIPCFADAVQQAAGGMVLSKTLDSNTALCQGSWTAAMTRFPAASEAGGEGRGVREGAVEQALQELGEFGMDAAAREALCATFSSVQAEQVMRRVRSAVFGAKETCAYCKRGLLRMAKEAYRVLSYALTASIPVAVKTVNPAPYTLNSDLETLNPKPQILDLETLLCVAMLWA